MTKLFIESGKEAHLSDVVSWWEDTYPASVFPYVGEKRKKGRDVGASLVSEIRSRMLDLVLPK